jgi:NTE family protein
MKWKSVFRFLQGKRGPRTVALALGGGGARGLAHIAVLEALDELGVKPVAIAGTSAGAVVGAAYASGMAGADIRRFAVEVLRDNTKTMGRLLSLQIGKIREAGLFASLPMQADALAIVREFLSQVLPETFEDLKIPLKVVAADYWAREEVVFDSGPLLPAVAASAAIPGVARPVEFAGRVLIDGGAINPLPFDLLRNAADIVIAVDITRMEERHDRIVPAAMDTLFMANHIMTYAIVSEKLKSSAPDILLRPKVHSFGALDFFRATPILRAAEPIKEEVKQKLGVLLDSSW